MDTSDSSSNELKITKATKKDTGKKINQLNVISYAESITTPKSITNNTKFNALAKSLNSLPSTTIVPNDDGVTEKLVPEKFVLHFSERKDDELEPKKKKKGSFR